MTKDEVTRMAHEAAGFDGTTSLERPVVLYAAMSKDFLDKFASLVAAAEREACARVCEEVGPKDGPMKLVTDGFAQAIRERGEK